MYAITYAIELLEPLLATQPFSGEANSAVTYPYIPGSMARGACIRAYQNGRSVALAHDAESRALFFSNDVCFLHAYPAHPRREKRLLPRPRSWFVEKDEVNNKEAAIYDLAWADQNRLERPKSPGGLFCALSDQKALLHSPQIQMQIHNASENRNRKQAGSSQVYRYEALAAGQRFIGVVLAEEKTALEIIGSLLGRVMLLGGSHTGGYGRVTLTTNEITEWQGETPGRTNSSDKLIVTLLSPAIIRNPDGQPGDGLARLLLRDPDNPAVPYRAFTSLTLVGGFNRYWGLPLPQSWALDAGSVFCFNAADVDMNRLETLVKTGIGERRNEGYGRIAINWHTQEQYEQTEAKPPRPKRVELRGSAAEEIARRMATRRLRADLERGLRQALHPDKIAFRRLPSATQLAQVRVAARRAQAQNDLNVISGHLKNLKGAKAMWQQAHYNNESLYDWIINQTEMTVDGFKEKFLPGPLPQLADIPAEITPELQTEFIARFIDGLLKVAIEKARAEKEGASHG